MTSPLVAGAADLLPRELAVAAATCLLVLALGLYPQGVLDLTRSAAELWVARLPSAAAPGRPRKEVTDDDQLDLPL